jgi:hypothetical protein
MVNSPQYCYKARRWASFGPSPPTSKPNPLAGGTWKALRELPNTPKPGPSPGQLHKNRQEPLSLFPPAAPGDSNVWYQQPRHSSNKLNRARRDSQSMQGRPPEGEIKVKTGKRWQGWKVGQKASGALMKVLPSFSSSINMCYWWDPKAKEGCHRKKGKLIREAGHCRWLSIFIEHKIQS